MSKKEPNIRKQLMRALRSDIQNQIDDWKKNNKWKDCSHKCPISGIIMFKEDAHIDHYPKPFVQIADEWLESQKVTDLEEFKKEHLKYLYRVKKWTLYPDSLLYSWCVVFD